MKKVLMVLTVGLLFTSCDGDEQPVPKLSAITLTSEITVHTNGGFEYEVFCVEEGSLQRVNTKSNVLKPYSIGVMACSNSEGKPTGIAIASLTSDLLFVSLNDTILEGSDFSDSERYFSQAIEATENDLIGIISENRQLKVRVTSASLSVRENEPISCLVLQGEYL